MHYRKFTILTLLALLISVGPLAAQDEATECEDGFRLFDHELLATDPVCIPDNPQRIITLGMPSFETLMSYGIQPLASPSPYLQNYAGLVRPESQQYDSEAMLAEFGQTTFYAISLESIQLVNGDVIFIWTSSPTRELAEQSDERLQELVDDPLWGTLGAVQAGQVYEVGGHWIGSSFIAAHYLQDDLTSRLDVEIEMPNPFKPEAEETEATDGE